MTGASLSPDRAAALDQAFVAGVRSLRAVFARDLDAPIVLGDARARPGAELTGRAALAMFDAQMRSRHLDLAARALRARDLAFYTLGSSGHEGNAALAEATEVTDPAFLHHRSGAFFLHRAARAGYAHAARDVLLGLCASQTSTLASHLPRAVGMAVALDRRRRLALDGHPARETPADAIVLCSFGDASLGHSTALGALNAACSAAFQHVPVPILFVCEDSGLGIGVPTAPGFIAALCANKPGLAYFAADGCDLHAAFEAASAAVVHVRARRSPAFLHLRTVGLMVQAGSDPLLGTAHLLVAAGVSTPRAVVSRYEALRAEVGALAEAAAARPRLSSAAEGMAPIAPRAPARPVDGEARRRFWGERLPEDEPPLALAGHVNAALGDLLAQYPELLVFGEDVGPRGGVHGVTRGLQKRAGAARVFDTPLDEQAILGLALGAGQLGLLPVPEIQNLAYLDHALDPIHGEAFHDRGQLRNPMVVRVAGYGSVAALRDIPGVVIASPSRGDDAAAMLRTCVAAARGEGSVCLFVEPIALYHTTFLHTPGDGLYASPYRPDGAHVPIGSARVHGEGSDLLLVTFASGVWMSLRAARRLEAEGVRCRVLDLRWLAPLPVDDLLREAARCGRVLVVDETRRSGGVSESVFTALIEGGFRGPMRRVASLDSLSRWGRARPQTPASCGSFVPRGPAADLVLVQEPQIEAAAREIVRS